MKSPDGYYSLNSGINGANQQSISTTNQQKFRVFIQYKYPTKPI